MSAISRLVPYLVGPLALVSLVPGPADEPAFAPGTHTILTKTFTEQTTLELDDFEVLMDGNPINQEGAEVSLALGRRLVISDEYAELEGGRILDLYRTFDELAGDVTAELLVDSSESHTVTASSELEEALVRFEWDAEEEAYARSFEEAGTGEDAHLDALVLENDLRGFLPDGAVEETDSWQVDAEHLAGVLAPSGDLRLTLDGLGDEPYALLDISAMVGASLTSLGEVEGPWEGEITATYVGNGEEDGVRVGRIQLELDVSCQAELLDRYERAMESSGWEASDEYTKFDLDWRLTGAGELAWNLDGGHAHALRLELEAKVTAELGFTQDLFGSEANIDARYELSGETVFEVAVE